MFSGIAWWRRPAGWARDGAVVTVGAVAVLAAFAPAPLHAAGETGAPGGSGGASCPSSNPPNQMTLVAGTPQTAQLGSAFATGLQVALSNSDGCPVTSAAAGIPVTFSAPASGASGVFSTSASSTAVVGADAAGTVAAPPFTANAAAGSYTVTASSQFGSVSFSFTNTAAGLPARIVALPLKIRSASVTSRYAQPLQVRVLDANGDPVAGATVAFILGSGASGGAAACGASSSASAGASFIGGAGDASATTGASGVASSPLFTANATAGSLVATAAVSGKEPDGGSAGESSGASAGGAATPVSFSLANLAGRPASLTPGVGATQSAPAGSAFSVRLAVTVTDAQKNPVPSVPITFSAPAGGASGRFTVRSRGHQHRAPVTHPRTVVVDTNACGIAVAPAFTAGDTHGGYVVKATAKHARPAAFALVNAFPGQSQ
jgi:hypothetical protein